MSTKLLREHLPWVAPTIAIVLAATGYFSPSNSSDDTVSTQTVTRNTALAPSVPPSGQLVPEEQAAASLAALQSLSTAAPATPAPVLQPVAATAAPVAPQPQPQPQVVARVEPAPQVQPQPEPVAAAPAPQPTVSPTQNPAAFFGAAQANLAAANCINDLRAMSRQTRVYFPSGGLTGEAAGIEQARLLGLIAKKCPNVTIQVEGHSDPSGNPVVNQRLSLQRAEAVIQRIGATGVDVSRFVAKGLGSSVPSNVTGPQGRAYYDRRVEFSVIEDNRTASLSPSFSSPWRQTACVTDLQNAVANTNVVYAPGSVSVTSQDLAVVQQLAAKAAACPDARLRIVGHHSDVPGSGETPGTGRLRAVVMMSSLVGAGYDAEQIIIAAPSKSIRLANRPDLSDRRLDFDVILED